MAVDGCGGRGDRCGAASPSRDLAAHRAVSCGGYCDHSSSARLVNRRQLSARRLVEQAGRRPYFVVGREHVEGPTPLIALRISPRPVARRRVVFCATDARGLDLHCCVTRGGVHDAVATARASVQARAVLSPMSSCACFRLTCDFVTRLTAWGVRLCACVRALMRRLVRMGAPVAAVVGSTAAR